MRLAWLARNSAEGRRGERPDDGFAGGPLCSFEGARGYDEIPGLFAPDVG